METSNAEPVSLIQLRVGDGFTFRGEEYIIVKHGRGSKQHIARVSDLKSFTLSISAQVVKGEARPDTLAAYLAARELVSPSPSLRPGTKIRIVDNANTRAKGIAGVESVIVRTNTKTYTLANEWRVSPGFVEEV